jgi:hypothetical protein
MTHGFAMAALPPRHHRDLSGCNFVLPANMLGRAPKIDFTL